MKKLFSIAFLLIASLSLTMKSQAQTCPTDLVPSGYSLGTWKPNPILSKVGPTINNINGASANYVLQFDPYPGAISYTVLWIPEAYMSNPSACNLLAHQGCFTNSKISLTSASVLSFTYAFPQSAEYMNAHPILRDSVFYYMIYAVVSQGNGAFSDIYISGSGTTCNGCDESPACKNLLDLYSTPPSASTPLPGVTKSPGKVVKKK